MVPVEPSPNFSLAELTTSGNHPEVENVLPDGWFPRLEVVAAKLEQARAILNCPLRISYGYRSPLLNHLCGGSPTSDHMQARAADFNPIGLGREDAFAALWADAAFMSDVDQLILERGCIHLGMGLRKRREGRGDRPYPLLAVWPEPLPPPDPVAA